MGGMLLRQYYLGCLAQASYLVADEESRGAAIVDPRRDVELYLAEAKALGLTIKYAILTHFHADFVAGHLELRDRVGAQVCLGAGAQAEYDYLPLKDGERLVLGPQAQLEVLATPGHTPESVCLAVYDLTRDAAHPQAVLTGDTLFIGDVGRPDLTASEGITALDLAGQLYESLQRKLLPLPDATLVYPGHGAGSLCGKNLSTDTVSSIGAQRAYNYALRAPTRAEFVRVVTADQPEAPSYFAYAARLNRGEHPTTAPEAHVLLQAAFLALRARGVQVLDCRDPIEFEGAHLVGSINVGLSGQFAMFAGTVLDPSLETVIIAPRGREQEALTRLRRVGFERISGYLRNGIHSLEHHSDLLHHTERITAPTVAEQLAGAERPLVLDVRFEPEWQQGHVAGSLNIPLSQLPQRLRELPRGRPLVVHCAAGYRSAIALSLLEREGLVAADMVGGFAAWQASSLPVVEA